MNTSGFIEGVHIRETMNAHGITSYNPSPGELEADQAMQKVYKSARPLGRLLGLILVNFQHITFIIKDTQLVFCTAKYHNVSQSNLTSLINYSKFIYLYARL